MCDFRTPKEILEAIGNPTVVFKGNYRTPLDLHGEGVYLIVATGIFYAYHDGKNFYPIGRHGDENGTRIFSSNCL